MRIKLTGYSDGILTYDPNNIEQGQFHAVYTSILEYRKRRFVWCAIEFDRDDVLNR